MKNKYVLLLSTFLLFVLVFVLQKVVFMLYYHGIYGNFGWTDYLKVLFYGLQHDASVAGYFSAIPGFLIIASLWVKNNIIRIISIGYFALIAAFMAVVFVVDLILYEYWGFRLDSTPLFYIQSPANALASTNWWLNVMGIVAFIVLAFILFRLFKKFLFVADHRKGTISKKLISSFIILFEVALLFLPIRGGVKQSTMNVGKVYFSNDLVLNHAAVNPAFSLFESLTLEQNFEKQYRFMSEEKAASVFLQLQDRQSSDSIPQLFAAKRPNVVFVILESFMSLNMSELGGIPGVAVNLDALSREGLLFTNFYANSFRTDRGLVSVLSGFPAQPSTSIMKYPRKLQHMPSFPSSMKQVGYDLQYFYGGDADFTSMRSYLKVCGFDDIIEDVSFPAQFRTSKWGVPDHLVFSKLLSEIKNEQQVPFLKVIQTLSSHNPYDVPFRKKLEDPYLNSVAYTDSCLGNFIKNLKQTEAWKNTVVVLVPDHAMRYPYDIDNRAVDRYKIPLVVIGGALSSKGRIETYGSQIDIAATLLAQLNIEHLAFKYSKNMMDASSPHFGYFTFQNGFGMVTPENEYVFDCETGKEYVNTGRKNENKTKAEAFIQTLYNDIATK